MQTDASSRQPTIRVTNEVAAVYPEMLYTRRINTHGLVYGFFGGEDLGSLAEDTGNWMEVATHPTGDGISEEVVVQRTIDARASLRAFFTLSVGLE